MKCLIRLAYVGTPFVGFQMQPNGRTIQGELQSACERIFAATCSVLGCSRTDSGVHAEEYYATVVAETSSSIKETQIPRALNTYLPAEIRCFEARFVPEDFSLHQAIRGKEYIYRISTASIPNPFDTHRVLWYPYTLQLSMMREACTHLVGKHDFAAFMSVGGNVATTVRTIMDLHIEETQDEVRIVVSADGFLYNMVRIIVGTLLEISEGKCTLAQLDDALHTGDRRLTGFTAAPDGLYLHKVFLDF